MLIHSVTRVRKSHRMTIPSYEDIVLAGPDKKGWHTYQAGSSRFKQACETRLYLITGAPRRNRPGGCRSRPTCKNARSFLRVLTQATALLV